MDIDALKQLFDMHIKECDQRDVRNTKSFDSITGMVKGIWDAMDKNRDTDKSDKDAMKKDITNLQIRLALGLGGLIMVSKAVDWALTYFGHK